MEWKKHKAARHLLLDALGMKDDQLDTPLDVLVTLEDIVDVLSKHNLRLTAFKRLEHEPTRYVLHVWFLEDSGNVLISEPREFEHNVGENLVSLALECIYKLIIRNKWLIYDLHQTPEAIKFHEDFNTYLTSKKVDK